jgi:hypothetical protein
MVSPPAAAITLDVTRKRYAGCAARCPDDGEDLILEASMRRIIAKAWTPFSTGARRAVSVANLPMGNAGIHHLQANFRLQAWGGYR